MSWSILYLHGVGQGVNTDQWYSALHASMDAHGIDLPPISSRRIIRPSYVRHLEVPPTEAVGKPTSTKRESGTPAERSARRAQYLRGQARAVEGLPSTTAQGFDGAGEFFNVGAGPAPTVLRDAKRYLTNKNLRSAVLHEVIGALGTQRDLVVIAHSLGSLVAIDLLAHLPPTVHVRRLVTIGSPVGSRGFLKSRPEHLLPQENFPYEQVDLWVNLLSPWDIVTQGLSITPWFPAAVDVRIPLPALQHAAHHYLSHPATARVIADALRPPHIGHKPGKAIEVSLTAEESSAVDSISFARLVEQKIARPERRQRFHEALLTVQEDVARRMAALRSNAGRPVSYLLGSLAAGAEDDFGFTSRTLEDQLLFAVVSATNNPIAPFEIDCLREQTEAVKDLWAAYGYSTTQSIQIVEAIKMARDVFDDSWKKYVLGAAGLALLAAGPIGLVMAAPAGLAGAAAITASLAAFGPGGMVGGMALAGGLLGVGGAVTRTASIPTNMSADMVQTQCVRIMAFTLARKRLDVPVDAHAGWRMLAAWHGDLCEERESLATFSEDGAAVVKSVDSKIRIVARTINWMVERDLCPQLDGPASENTEAPGH